MDDAGGRASLEERQKQPAREEAGEMVDGEAQHEAVAASRPPLIGPVDTDASVVDQHIQPGVIARHLSDRSPNTIPRGNVGCVERCSSA